MGFWDAGMLECSSPGDLSIPGIEPVSLVSPALAGRFFATVQPGMPIRWNSSVELLEFSSVSGLVQNLGISRKAKHSH